MGCGASAKKGEGSPSLNEYFEKLREFSEEEILSLDELKVLRSEGKVEECEALNKKIAANRQAFVKVREKLLKDSFDHHDISGDGILSEDESSIVFQHITEEKRGHDKILALIEVRRELAFELGMSKKAFQNMEIPNKEQIQKRIEDDKADIKKEAARERAHIEEDMNKALADYQANKVARDKVAFGILDASGNGRIEKKEFLAAFDPTSEVHDKFMDALGLCLTTATKEEKENALSK